MRIFDMALCFLVVFLVSVGQVMLKFYASKIERVPQIFDLAYGVNIKIVFAFTVYGVAMVLWLFVLSRIPLSKAFSFFGLSFFMVPVMAYFLLGEGLDVRTIFGSILIFFGVLISVV